MTFVWLVFHRKFSDVNHQCIMEIILENKNMQKSVLREKNPFSTDSVFDKV